MGTYNSSAMLDEWQAIMEAEDAELLATADRYDAELWGILSLHSDVYDHQCSYDVAA